MIMKITSINNHPQISFLSKNKNIRLADDIVRKTRQEFPAYSPSYIDSYWQCLRTPKHSDGKNNLKILANKLGNRLFACRINTNFRQDILEDPLALLKTTKEHKVANCIEYAQLTESCLLANGYKNTKLAAVKIKLSLYDKSTDEKVYEDIKPFDHIIVIANLNDDDENSDEPVVLDGWIGKAMSISEAKREYLGMLSSKDMQEIASSGLQKYRHEQSSKQNNKEIDPNNLNYKIQILFDEIDKSFLKENFEKSPTTVIEMIRTQFPNLILETR